MIVNRTLMKSYLRVISEAAEQLTDAYYDEVNKKTADVKEKLPNMEIDTIIMEFTLRGLAGYEKQFLDLVLNTAYNFLDDHIWTKLDNIVELIDRFKGFSDNVSFSEFSDVLQMMAYFGVNYTTLCSSTYSIDADLIEKLVLLRRSRQVWIRHDEMF